MPPVVLHCFAALERLYVSLTHNRKSMSIDFIYYFHAAYFYAAYFHAAATADETENGCLGTIRVIK